MSNDFDLNGMAILREIRNLLKEQNDYLNQIDKNTRSTPNMTIMPPATVSIPSVWTTPPPGYCDHQYEVISEGDGYRTQRCIQCGDLVQTSWTL